MKYKPLSFRQAATEICTFGAIAGMLTGATYFAFVGHNLETFNYGTTLGLFGGLTAAPAALAVGRSLKQFARRVLHTQPG